jgi:crossover junction endodeoxyribonuclease RusA
LALFIDAYPPDRRRRDLDNIQKAILDSLEKAGAYNDDSQIDLLIVSRQRSIPGGAIIITLQKLPTLRCILCGHAH